MHKYTFLFVLTFFSVSLLAQDAAPVKQHGFVGVETCGMCHKSEKQGKQLDIWKASRHANAFKTLQSEAANKIAKEKGLTVEAAKAPECLKCHASGYDVEATMLGKKFKIEDGVQCETCHGAGADYKDMKVMKNREEAIKAGMTFYAEKEKYCTGCHNSESPTFKEFKLETHWEMIQHPVPSAK